MLRSVGQRLRHPGPWAIDGAVAVVLLAFMVAQLALQEKPLAGQQPTTPIAYLLVVLTAAPLVTHRKWPLPSLAVCLAALLLYAPGGITPTRGWCCSPWSSASRCTAPGGSR